MSGDRESLLDRKKYEEISKTLGRGAPILFMPHYVADFTFCPERGKKGAYAVAISGVLLDGRKINAIIKVPLYFDVEVPADKVTDVLQKIQEKHIAGDFRNSVMYSKYEEIKAFPFMERVREKAHYLRLYFLKTSCRNNAIALVRNLGYETATDDKSKYYKIVSRNYKKNWADWATLSNYEVITDANFKDECIVIDIDDYVNLDPALKTSKELMFPKLLVMSWDIETHVKFKNMIPLPEQESAEIMVIGINFNWYWSELPIKRIAITRYSLPDSEKWQKETNTEVIVSKTERDLIENFFIIWDNYAPDYVPQFNGFGYDEPWIMDRATSRYKMYNYIVEKTSRQYPYYQIDTAEKFKKYYKPGVYKIDADTTKEFTYLTGYGFIGLDMMLLYKKIHPKLEKHSLKSFLEKEKIKSKDDMPYEVMHDRFSELREYPKMYKWHKGTSPPIASDQKTPAEVPEVKTEVKEVKKEETDWSAKSLAEVLLDITEYCLNDALRCQDLLRCRNLVMDKQNMAGTAFMSVQETFYNADSMKVVNIALGSAFREGYLGSSISKGEAFTGKYEGALVISPKQGIYVPKLTIRERIKKAIELKDKSFLQDLEMSKSEMEEWLTMTPEPILLAKKIGMHFMEKYGASVPESAIDDYLEEHLGIKPEHLEKSRKVLPKCLRDFIMEFVKRGNFGLDFASLYPSLIMCYNLSPEKMTTDKRVAQLDQAAGEVIKRIQFQHNGQTVKSWAIQHNGIQDRKDPGYKLGIFPTILLDLFNKRAIYKKELAAFKKEKEEFLKLSAAEQKSKAEEYEMLCARLNISDAKQNAVKLLMNTFYGTVGSRINALCRLDLAAAVTLFGREHISHARDVVEQILGHTVLYGDTDSLYIMLSYLVFICIDHYYYEEENLGLDLLELLQIQNKFEQHTSGSESKSDASEEKLGAEMKSLLEKIAGNDAKADRMKLKYVEDSIKITMANFEAVQKTVNNEIIKKSGNRFLSMAYEEVLYPGGFLSRKKYLGLMHIGAPVVEIKKRDQIFLRGIDLVKRHVSPMAKKIGWSIVEKIMAYNNYYSILELVHLEIDLAFNKKWDLRDFATKATFKAHKKNEKMHTFVRYLDEVYKVKIEDGEMLEYVVVKRYQDYDFTGRKVNLKVGDCMELLSIAEERNLEIDLMYYMSKSVCGQLARLISFYPMFRVELVSDEPQAHKDAGNKSFELAKKYILALMEKYHPKTVGGSPVRRSNYKVVTKILTKTSEEYKIPTIISSNKFELKSLGTFRAALLEHLTERATDIATDLATDFLKLSKRKMTPKEQETNTYRLCVKFVKHKYRQNEYKKRTGMYTEKKDKLIRKLDDQLPEFKHLFDQQRKHIEEYTVDSDIDLRTELNEDPAIMEQLRYVVTELRDDPACGKFINVYSRLLANEIELQKINIISETLSKIRTGKTGTGVGIEKVAQDFSDVRMVPDF